MLQGTIPFLDGAFEEQGVDTANISGLGDISLSATWRPAEVKGLSLNLGFILPTGEERDQPVIGNIAPSVFQLGTGAWQILLGAGYSKQVNKWALYTRFDVSLPLQTSSQGFRPAETYFLSAGASRAITENLRFGIAAVGSYTTEDEFQGVELANTGATSFSLKPSLIWQAHERFTILSSVDIPVYRDVNETGIAAGTSWRISFNTNF